MSKHRFLAGFVIIIIGLMVSVTLAQTDPPSWSTVDGVRNMTANPVDANESSPKRDLFWLKICPASDN